MITQYQRTKDLAKESRDRAATGPIVMHTKQLEMEFAAGRKRAYISEPQILGSLVQTMAMFVAEIAPGQAGGKHRHFNEAMIYILAGKGHSIIDEKRHDWSEGDVIAVPLYSWHQHFNDDTAKAVRYLGMTNLPLLRAMGLNRLEDAGDQT